MGFLRLHEPDEHDRENWRYIRRALKRRGMIPATKGKGELIDWEVHGPHGWDFNYQVFIGWAEFVEERDDDAWAQFLDKRDEQGLYSPEVRECVAVYPWATYIVRDPSDWGSADPVNRIPTIR